MEPKYTPALYAPPEGPAPSNSLRSRLGRQAAIARVVLVTRDLLPGMSVTAQNEAPDDSNLDSPRPSCGQDGSFFGGGQLRGVRWTSKPPFRLLPSWSERVHRILPREAVWRDAIRRSCSRGPRRISDGPRKGKKEAHH